MQFSYAQILATKDVKYDVVSTFAFLGHNNSFKECERTVYSTLRWYPEGTKTINELSIAFGMYINNDDALLVCSYLSVCTIRYVYDSVKKLKYFRPDGNFNFDRNIMFHYATTGMVG